MAEIVAINRGDDRRRPRESQEDSPAEYEVDPEKRLVVVRFTGHVTVQKIAEYVAHLRMHPAFHPSFGEIADLREVREIELQTDDFLRLADKIDPFFAEAKRAFVVRTTVQNHAARMHKILRPKRNTEIFESFEQAERWVRG
ncbi:MAG: hypothetical protein WAM79_12905 [Candidatus Sulfotelmatobacter sp.]